MRKRHIAILVVVPIVAITLWTWVVVRFVFAAWTGLRERGASPHTVHVTGQASETLVAPRVGLKVELCGPHRAEHVREAQRRGQRIFAADELVVFVEKPAADSAEEERCATLNLSTSRVAEALRWHRGLVAAGFVAEDDENTPECAGEEIVAVAKGRTALAAIGRARAQADALLAGLATPKQPAVDAQVSSDDGSWDQRCERVVTAEAELTIPTDAEPAATK
jgi:hypothetical protein